MIMQDLPRLLLFISLFLLEPRTSSLAASGDASLFSLPVFFLRLLTSYLIHPTSLLRILISLLSSLITRSCAPHYSFFTFHYSFDAIASSLSELFTIPPLMYLLFSDIYCLKTTVYSSEILLNLALILSGREISILSLSLYRTTVE